MVRWLTRAFSSITLAVMLLTLISLYGVIASMPLMYLLLGGVYTLITLGTVGITGIVLWQLARRGVLPGGLLRVLIGLIAMIMAGGIAVFASIEAHLWITAQLWFDQWHATIIYRLPLFEMTELEFYAWWPMQVLLGLFVLNMIWATIRRIEFKFVNIGVLTVHTGIVTLAIGAMLYGYFKFEGDMILMRRDLGGNFHHTFYDIFTPAVFIQRDNGEGVMIPLPDLPRYNDYEPGELELELHSRPGVRELVGDDVRITIPGFLAYARLRNDFVDAHEVLAQEQLSEQQMRQLRNVVVQLASGDRDGPDLLGDQPVEIINLIANAPAQRVYRADRFEIELLDQPEPQRITDLMTPLDAPHVLVIRIPEKNYQQTLAIEPNQTLQLGDTGYQIEVLDVGPYGIPFVTPGYEGATDSRAMIKLTGPDKTLTRMVMYRYPERSQDFVPKSESMTPNAQDAHAAPFLAQLGARSDPDPDIEMVYLDNTKAQFHLIHNQAQEPLRLVLRLPGVAPMLASLDENRILVPGQFQGHPHWMHIQQHLTHALPTLRAMRVPQELRNPRDEGDYTHAVIPIDVEKNIPQADGSTRTWKQRLWLKHMRYPHWPEEFRRPMTVEVPGLGNVSFAFSRQQHQLPFAVALEDFEMIPIPGSDVERDFVATLALSDLDQDGIMFQQPKFVQARLNSPVIHRASTASLPYQAVKISQVAWDKGDPTDPAHAARDEQGRFINQQRYTILGIANNVGIRIIFIGASLIVLGIPWAFYIKPWLLQRQKRKIQQHLAMHSEPHQQNSPGSATSP